MADKVYLPLKRVTRGVNGYKGDPRKIVVVDGDGKEVKGKVKPT